MSEVEAKNGTSESTPPAPKRAKMSAGGASNAALAAAAQAQSASASDGGAAPHAEERDFDEETQKALEEIDANQNEIDLLNEKASEEILKVSRSGH